MMIFIPYFILVHFSLFCIIICVWDLSTHVTSEWTFQQVPHSFGEMSLMSHPSHANVTEATTLKSQAGLYTVCDDENEKFKVEENGKLDIEDWLYCIE